MKPGAAYGWQPALSLFARRMALTMLLGCVLHSPLAWASSNAALLDGLPADETTQSLVLAIKADPQQAGSWLDLAVLLCQNGQDTTALPLLAYIEKTFAPPAGIREVIRLLRVGGCERPGERGKALRLTGSAQRGYDSNVNQGASSALFELGSAFPNVVVELTPDFLPRGDHFTQLDASGSWAAPDGSHQLGLQARYKRHDQLKAQDVGIVSGVADRVWDCPQAQCRVSGVLSFVTLGARAFQTEASLQAGWQRQLGPEPGSQALALEATLSRQRFATQPSFDAWLAQLRGSWRVPLANWLPAAHATDHLLLSTGYGVDVPSAGRPGGRREVRLLGVSGSLDLSSRHTPGLAGEWSLQRQWTQESQAYSPGLIDAIRRPQLNALALAAVQTLDRNNRLRLELRRNLQRDTVSLFAYAGHTISLSWLWQDDF